MSVMVRSMNWFGVPWRTAIGAVAVGVAACLPVQAQTRGGPDFTELVEQVGPSVVNIRTMERVRTNGGSAEIDMQELFRRFFGIPLPGGPRQQPMPRRGAPQPQDEEVPRGVGSGFILSSDGYVMTNAHVVEGADEMVVTLPDKREYKAKLIGADERSDVAVVKIEATGLPAVKIGEVGRLKVGEWVLAIGSPFNLESTVTAGIVSAKQRDTGDYLPLIQTDVAINPGNSGGPLINMKGEVVGINSQIYSRTGSYAGISFSIPIDEAIRVSDQLRSNGRVTRGRIGVTIGEVTKDVAESIGLNKPTGVQVSAIEPGGPAEKAGIEAGDIILKIDGRVIDKRTDLQRAIGAMRPGARATVTLFRRGSTKDVQVTIAELDPQKSPARRGAPRDEGKSAPATPNALGLSLSDMSDAARRDAKVKGGVRVDAVADAAARAGLREGDIILSIGNAEVSSVKEFEAALAKQDKTRPINVLVRRGEWTQYVLIRPSR